MLDFARRAKEGGSSVVFISHNIYHAHEIGDRLVILDRGQIAAEYRRGEVSVEDLIRRMQVVARGEAEAAPSADAPLAAGA